MEQDYNRMHRRAIPFCQGSTCEPVLERRSKITASCECRAKVKKTYPLQRLAFKVWMVKKTATLKKLYSRVSQRLLMQVRDGFLSSNLRIFDQQPTVSRCRYGNYLQYQSAFLMTHPVTLDEIAHQFDHPRLTATPRSAD